MPKKSYRRRNKGGDEEVPKRPEQILQEIKNEDQLKKIPPPPEQNSWMTPKQEKPVEPEEPVPPPPQEPVQRQDDGWFIPDKSAPQEPPPQEDSWFSPKKPVPPVYQEEEQTIPEEVAPEQKPSIFTLGFIIALVFSVIALILLSIGIYILARKPLYPAETTGTVKTAKCVNNNCILVIEFTPEGAKDKLTSNELQISGNYNKGDSVKINYNPDNPTTFGVNLISPKVFGWSFIGISVLLLLIIWGIYYFMHR